MIESYTEKWIQAFDRAGMLVLSKRAGGPHQPHLAPQVALGHWDLAGEQSGPSAVLRWTGAVAVDELAVPASWKRIVGAESGRWDFRVAEALQRLDALLEEMRLVDGFESEGEETSGLPAGAGADGAFSEDGESSFPEGAAKYRQHRSRERDSDFTRRAKRHRLAIAGALACDVCGFDFSEAFGSHGLEFIEAHHKVPVSQLGGTAKTKMSDLAMVCSNCHRMLHRGSPLPTVEALRDLREAARRFRRAASSAE